MVVTAAGYRASISSADLSGEKEQRCGGAVPVCGLTKRTGQKVRDLCLTWSQVNGAATAGYYGSHETVWATTAGGGRQRTRGLMDHRLDLGTGGSALRLLSWEGCLARLSCAGGPELLNKLLRKPLKS